MKQPGARTQSPSILRPRLLGAVQIVLALALLTAATLPLSAPAVSPEPAQAEVDLSAEEASDEGEEELELEEEEEEGEEEEVGGNATVLPPECLLRSAEPTVVAQLNSGSLRLTLRYTASVPTKITLHHWLKGGKGSLQFDPVTRHLGRQGALRLTTHLDEHELAKVRAARVFVVDLDAPAAPASCEQYLTLRLGAKDLTGSRATWSE